MTADRKAAPAAEKARSPTPKLPSSNVCFKRGWLSSPSLSIPVSEHPNSNEPCPSIPATKFCPEAIHEFWIRSESTILFAFLSLLFSYFFPFSHNDWMMNRPEKQKPLSVIRNKWKRKFESIDIPICLENRKWECNAYQKKREKT